MSCIFFSTTVESFLVYCNINANRAINDHVSICAGALARGDAAILLRFPHKGYREKIWDHAAGVVIVQEAGAVSTDASGDLSHRDPH